LKPIPAGAPVFARSIEYGSIHFETYKTQTDKGRTIEVGVPVNPKPPAYWCHAHSSLSYHLFGYSVPAESLKLVLEDEYEEVSKKPERGDIVVWWQDEKWKHSARIESAVHHFGSASTDVLVSNKPGLALPLQTRIPIADAIPKDQVGKWVRMGKYFRRKGNDPFFKKPIDEILAWAKQRPAATR